MNHLPNSRMAGEGKSFEILQTEDEVTIVVRDRATDEVCQIVSFRGQTESKKKRSSFGHRRLQEPALAGGRRW